MSTLSLFARFSDMSPEDFDPKTIEAYRTWAFPAALQAETHEPYFALHEAAKWVTIDGLMLFLRARMMGPLEARVAPTPASLAAFKALMLPPPMRAHPFFAVLRAQDWLSAPAFAVFQGTGAARAGATSVTVGGVERPLSGSGLLLADPNFVLEVEDEEAEAEEIIEYRGPRPVLCVKRKRSAVHL